MQLVFDACWAMRTAISTGNTTSLKSANEKFRQCKLKHFSTLFPKKSNIILVNNHFVWDDVFVDSLIKGHDVRKFAQRYADARALRGSSSKNAIAIKTSAVKGKGKAKFTFTSQNHQEIAVIAEPKGRISLRVYCKRAKKWHNDDEDINIGSASRVQIFDNPNGVDETVVLEVINCGENDISFVVICN